MVMAMVMVKSPAAIMIGIRSGCRYSPGSICAKGTTKKAGKVIRLNIPRTPKKASTQQGADSVCCVFSLSFAMSTNDQSTTKVSMLFEKV